MIVLKCGDAVTVAVAVAGHAIIGDKLYAEGRRVGLKSCLENFGEDSTV